MNVLVADVQREALERAAETLENVPGEGAVLFEPCDVADEAAVAALQARAQALGPVHCLMNNAGASIRTPKPWEKLDAWKRVVDINLWGIIQSCHAFLPKMLEDGAPGVIINTGSKQGITNPPGNYAYNLSKAGVKTYTESLAHALREEGASHLSAHLLIPGFTYTGMIARVLPEKPASAWTPEEVVAFMLERLAEGDFYLLCPDHETPRVLDEKRMRWNLGDLLENRSALSRWDPAYADAFARFMAEDP
jgi:NAD(P)-dependent dehydrogenase (short-subunit alcohol dehydrogenase family)